MTPTAFETGLSQAAGAAQALAALAGRLAYLGDAIPIAVVNHSTTFQLPATWVPALQFQIERDFFPRWSILASLGVRTPGPKDWALGIFDTADQAGALGYHDVTPQNLPLGKVFVTVSQQAGVSLSSVLSHELLEMLLDAYVNLLVQDATTVNRAYAYEACDAVEDTSYTINGVEVSNFVYPAYFQPTLGLGKPYDFLDVLAGPVPALTPGGYMAFLQNGTWGQVTGSGPAARLAPIRSGARGTSGRLYRRFGPSIVSTYGTP